MNFIITGSTRGIGRALAEYFLKNGHKVLINGTSKSSVTKALEELMQQYKKNVIGFAADVCDKDLIDNMFRYAISEFNSVDVLIANAGINQIQKPFANLDLDNVKRVIDINIIGMINSSHAALNFMDKGYIYTMEGFGSNNMMTSGMTIYGMTKRALTYFTKSLAKECKNSSIKVGLLSPGMVATDFMKKELDENTSNILSILGDKPETVAAFLGSKILKNKKNGAHFLWLTNIKAAYRFMTAAKQKKRKLFD